MSSDIFKISRSVLAWDTKRNRLGGAVQYVHFMASQIVASTIVKLLQTTHKTDFLKGHRPG